MVYTDEVNKNMLTGNYCYYNDSTGYSMATDSAVAIDYSQRDTMYMHADTFKVYTFYMDTDSMYREVRGLSQGALLSYGCPVGLRLFGVRFA